MIFLAVTMGFFAENIRENLSGHSKEKEYIANAFYAVNQQISQNLISFSKEVTPFEKVSLLYEPTVSVTTRKSGNSVIITVSDNGNGIPEKIKD